MGITHPEVDSDAGLADPIYVRICQRIRADILAGIFTPGQRLKISDLTKRYHVSQMPIREALQQLQGEWLVTILPNRGASVRKVDEAFIGQMYDIRTQLESILTRRCAERAEANDVAKVAAALAAWEEKAGAGDVAGAMEANSTLHRAIYQVAGNPLATELLQRHFGLLQSLRNVYGFGADRLRVVAAEHRELLEAIRQRDGARAERAAERHCESARDDLLSRMRNAVPLVNE